MRVDPNFKFWAFSENYLSFDSSYSITSVGREAPVIYRRELNLSFFQKATKIVSFVILFPLSLYALAYRDISRKIYSWNVLDHQTPIKKAGSCDVIATANSKETQEWRKKLIAAAEKNIVISGNYCGGAAFDELLNCLQERLDAVSDLKVVIISHPMFIIESEPKGIKNLSLIQSLEIKYPGRFKIVYSASEEFSGKRVINHTKCTVIDNGRYFIQGGSGIKDNFVGEGKLSANNNQKRDQSSFFESFLPGDFRDQDFVFKANDPSIGKKMFREALYLAYKWDRLKGNGFLSPDDWDLDKLNSQDPLFKEFPALHDEGVDLPSDSVISDALLDLMKAPIPAHTIYRNDIFDFSARKAKNVAVKLFFTGAETVAREWEEELIHRINNAKAAITIDHMYFHPTKKLRHALVEAANRGIQIEIVIPLNSSKGSISEKFFGHRNKTELVRLHEKIDPSARKNLHVYQYKQGENGLHKKVVVIDDWVLAGSSNMGLKSLKLMGDHEMNFSAQSEKLSEETLKVIEEDKLLSQKIETIQAGFQNHLVSFFHKKGTSIWG